MDVTLQAPRAIKPLNHPDKWRRLWLIRDRLRSQSYCDWWNGTVAIDNCRALDRKANRVLSRLGWRVESVTDGQPESAAESVTDDRCCIVCGVELGGKRGHSKTCSPKCRKTLSRTKHQAEAMVNV
jgi:hypothetical protein